MSNRHNKNFALTLDKIENMPTYAEYAHFFKAIRKMAESKIGANSTVYDLSNVVSSIVFKEDIKVNDGRIEILGHSLDAMPTAIAGIENKIEYRGDWYPDDDDNAKPFDPTIEAVAYNTVFYYPKYNVVFAYYCVFDSPGSYTIRSIAFSKDDTSVEQFAKYMHEREREINQQGIIILKDARHGCNKIRSQLNEKVARDDVFMEEDLKKEIFRSIDVFFNESKDFYSKYNIPYRRGILLFGKPGNGKTTLVKSIVNSISAPVVYWQITEFTNSESINEVFEYAAERSPVVLVIEDVDSMPVEARSAFLNTLDGATSKDGVFLIGTTNYPDKVDDALKNRAGRFDRAYEIKPPNEHIRYTYLKHKGLSNFLSDEEVHNAAKLMEGFSVASLNELYTSAARQHYYDGNVNFEEIIKDLKKISEKQKKDDWYSEDNNRVGF